jgi:hypothetical protein
VLACRVLSRGTRHLVLRPGGQALAAARIRQLSKVGGMA